MEKMDREELEWYHNIQDPWDWVTVFEDTVSKYCGYKYGVAVDSNSNAIRLLLHYLNIREQHIVIPARTYVSVPNQIILSGNYPVFADYKWDGFYQFGSDIPIIDAATAFYENMGEGQEDKFMVLSFHKKKILNIGKGGMILTNDEDFVKWSRPMIYDGRHKDKLYKDDEFECIGWHMYMTPEDAMKGLQIFQSPRIQSWNEHCGSSKVYGDLREQKIYKDYVSVE
jgi:dTDP-4-amino-4,6-dideoxygalactose transaminase